MTQNKSQRDALNVMLVAEESAGIQVLRILEQSHHNVVAVLASESTDSKAATVGNAANKMGFNTLPAELVKQASFASEVRRTEVDLFLNVHSLYLVNCDIIDAVRMGAFNMHPGPLPQYAGLNVPSWAIYHGETEHAVTIHEMVPRIDAGYVAYQERFPISDDDTGFTLMSKCIRAGVPLIARLLEDAARGIDCIPRIEQDFSQRCYFNRHAPDDGWLPFNRPARDVVNHVRAANYAPFQSPWGVPKTALEILDIGIVKTSRTNQPTDAEPGTVANDNQGGVLVAAADEWVRIEKIELDGEPMDVESILEPGLRLISHLPATNSTTPIKVAAES